MKIKLKITSGIYRSRNIICNISNEIRPTQTKQRQSVFNMLENNLEKLHFLDICCGSGIIGFEALSRGAEQVVWIDESRNVFKDILSNVNNLKISNEKYKIICSKWQKALKNFSANDRFDLIYFDPPFVRDETVSQTYCELATLIKEKKILNKNGILILEYFSKFVPNIKIDGFVLTKQKKYGNTGISFWSMS